MSWTKETTLWCDGDGCSEWIRYQTGKVSSARTNAEADAGWDCSSAEDLCGNCAVRTAKTQTEGDQS